MIEKGLIQNYTGEGKGKTTAAVGLLVRAVGQGLKCCFVSFFKDFERHYSGELAVFEKLDIKVYSFVKCSPCFNPDIPFKEMRDSCLSALDTVSNELFSDASIELLVLDEINNALRYKFISDQEMIAFMDKKPSSMELILTGRGASETVMERSDLVSKIKKIKHPYDKNIGERKGIEY